MNPYNLEMYDVTVVYSVGNGYEECCHVVAAIEKQGVIDALQWYYKDAKNIVIIFT